MKRKNLEEIIQITKRFKSDKNHKISTKLIHSGQEPDKYSGAVMVIYLINLDPNYPIFYFCTKRSWW